METLDAKITRKFITRNIWMKTVVKIRLC